jgi:Helix-turn-helix domain
MIDTANSNDATKSDKQQAAGFQIAKEGWLKLLASYPNLSGADYAVAIVIASHLNSKDRKAWPSIELIAALTNREQSTVWRSIERLKQFELVTVERVRGRSGSWHNTYSPTLGSMDREPSSLRRCNANAAKWKKKDCRSETGTSEGRVEEPLNGTTDDRSNWKRDTDHEESGTDRRSSINDRART